VVLQGLLQTFILQGFQCCQKLRDIEPDLYTSKPAGELQKDVFKIKGYFIKTTIFYGLCTIHAYVINRC
jgi:hypothetical protein